jgi:putative hemolysin
VSLRTLLSQFVQVSNRLPDDDRPTDDYGNPLAEYAEPVAYPARLEQRAGDEVTADRDTQLADWVLFLPPDAVVDGYARVVDGYGRAFEVVGPPAVQHTPRGAHHIEARLRHIEG